METTGEIILYQPDNSVQLEVRTDGETVWLTQAQIADLFGVRQPAISKHLKNIFASGELEESNTYSILEYVGNDGKQIYRTKYYNLDAILSVGYRVNSVNATQFRIWANKVLKDYILKGYAVNNRIERLEKKVSEHDEKIDFFIRTSLPPREGLFFDGQIFDAFEFVQKLIKSAKKSIVLIDNYVDDSVLTMLVDKRKGVSAAVYTKTIAPPLKLAAEKFNSQYGDLTINAISFTHDRFLILDEAEIYLIGASLKDLGKKWFAFAKLDATNIPEIMKRIKK